MFNAIDRPEVWSYLPCRMEGLEDMTTHVREALDGRERGTDLPFAVLDKASNQLVGMTRVLGISTEDRSAEIGWTWYSSKVWRTRVNTECKYLLLRYCFEALHTIRVQFRADLRNTRSNEAILRIGAKQEGIFRKNKILYNGHIRDSVFYSILEEEWPEVQQRLQQLLTSRHGAGPIG
ncbi:RimJ/RimL family protein N-acetyltransferase [Paenibacillus sacheonensis]|nr:RimJ/RimL family protein N-acetyltransferase [Paenibacillus sacheonensis]